MGGETDVLSQARKSSDRIIPVLRDLVFAARHLTRAPGFALAAILTLSLGTGANTAIFSLINGFLRPLPVPDAERIVILAASSPGDETGFRYKFSFPALQDVREQATVFSDVFAFDIRIGGLGRDSKTAQFVYCVVTGNFFSGLGIAPAAGRLFEPGEGESTGRKRAAKPRVSWPPQRRRRKKRQPWPRSAPRNSFASKSPCW